jgi:carbon monoxide dehydrogenase subunit G
VTRLHETITVTRPIDESFAYVADFATTAEWDPGIAQARRVDDGPIGLGSRFAVVAVFNGRRLDLIYEIVAYEPPERIVLRGEGKGFRGVDEITLTTEGNAQTRIDYVADIGLTGIAKLAEPFMKGRFDTMAKKAVTGLKAALEAE